MKARMGPTTAPPQRERRVGLKRVCLLGHEPATVRALGRLLGKGFYLVVAEDADKLLSALHSGSRFDGLILETKLSDVNAARLIETLGAEPLRLPVFVFTSSDDLSLHREISKLEVAGFFRKPKDIWRLAETLHERLGPTHEGTRPPAMGTGADAVVARAIQFIDQNLTDISSSADVSSHLGVTREHLSRQFTKYTGHTLWDFITRCRVEKAKELLGESSLLVKQVFRKVGFNCESSFFRAFTKHAGQTPLEYRKTMGNS